LRLGRLNLEENAWTQSCTTNSNHKIQCPALQSNLTQAAPQTLMGLPAQGKLTEPHHMHSAVYWIFGIK